MPMPTVEHIANVSFKDHFLSAQEAAPKNGSIQVNSNTFDVTFVDGKVNAKFTSGNWFSNFFRSSTLARFTQTLQTQYDTWVAEQAQAGGFKDNPNVAAVNTAIDGIIDVLHANHEKIDKDGIHYPKTVMKAFAMPDTAGSLSEDDAVRFMHATEGNGMPPNMARLLSKLGDIGKLAALRNQLTRVPDGMECDRLVREAGFLTHTVDNNDGKSGQEIKRYVLNMLDTVIDGFLSAVNGMTDKNTQALDFLRKFDGACVEAKGDNIQEYIGRAMNVITAGRSEEKHDLAYSVTAEFNALADEVKAPFREAARKECEADVRAQCAKKGITDEAAIEDTIDHRVEMMLFKKDAEITPLVEQAIRTRGKSFLYENLCGALRPVTTVEKNNGKWTVTTLVDKDGAPVKKPVSAFDIDKNFDRFVEMYMEDAVTMGMVENKTHTVSGKATFATKQDLCAKGVIKLAADYLKAGAEDFAALLGAVKKELRPGFALPDDKLEGAVRDALDKIRGTRKNDDDETKADFRRLVNNFATAAYKDMRNDGMRLVHLLARSVEHSRGKMADNCLADLEGKALRCAQMLKFAFKDKVVDVAKAQKAIADTIKTLVKNAFPSNPSTRASKSCKDALQRLMFGGRLFTLLVEEAMIFIFITTLHYNEMGIKLLAQFVVIVLNYVISKLIVFRKKTQAEQD